MRLTHIKLAGFKSFVDPTVIPVPAQLTGVVGPNGCGKSNVIDAVRWVLGESSAKNLRGETMQDVIFNGSSTRKPASRASVELAFNNELGRAAGQWSQYSEISVKRVLERNGDSTYSINNLRVRRRDVADLFLGTGVGARAYAIIEQGMIARLIEAKPEELRGYLEEAAGVSKYKERRRETEARLKDARDNLNRVADIQRELKTQLEKLATQAEIAQQYRDLQTELTLSQHRLWYAKKRDAKTQRERVAGQLSGAQIRHEAEIARLRQIEATLEGVRQAHFAGQDALNAQQASYYQAQSEVARIEQSMQHQNATRERLHKQIQELGARHEAQILRRDAALASHHEWLGQQPGLQAALTEAELAARQATDSHLPQKEEALRGTQLAVGEAQRALTQFEQARQVDENSLGHTKRQIEQLDVRRRRLEQEQAQLPRPDAVGLAKKEIELQDLAAVLDAALAGLKAAETALPELDAARADYMRDFEAARKALHQVEAELAALKKLQESLKADEKLAAWLRHRGLDQSVRLWEKLRVAPGWEAAVEAVLRERLQAVSSDVARDWFDDAPPDGWLYLLPGTSKVVKPDEQMAANKAAKWQEVKLARMNAIAAPLKTPYGTFDANPDASLNIVKAVLLAQTLANVGQPVAIDFTLADNTVVTLDAKQMIEVGLSLSAREQEARSKATEIRAQIDFAKTFEQLNALII